jgi:hypothetical protein
MRFSATFGSIDRIEFTVDIPTCGRLPKSTLAHFQTLAEFALTENGRPGKSSNPPFVVTVLRHILRCTWLVLVIDFKPDRLLAHVT